MSTVARTFHFSRLAVPAVPAVLALLAGFSLAGSARSGESSSAHSRDAVISLIERAVASGKKPSFEMRLGRQRVRARIIAATDQGLTVSASGLTMPQSWKKISDLSLFQAGLDLAGNDAAARRKSAAFALASGLTREAKRVLDGLLERNPRDTETYKLLAVLEKKAVPNKKPVQPAARAKPAIRVAQPAARSAPLERPLRANYYVAPQGSDRNPGTFNRPFATLRHALDAVQPGQLIYLRGGTYRPTQQTIFHKKSGRPGAYIELRGYPGEQAVIDGGAVPGSYSTWRFTKAGYWRIRNVHLTNGRGAGIYVDHDSRFIEFDRVEASYNGKAAVRGGHGFLVEGKNIRDILFKNCDAHHNANHKTKPGEDVAANIYQHGDGWRIFSGRNIRLTGCRAWRNMDDAYDLTQAREPVELVECWAAYSGEDDAQGSITGKPHWSRRYDGDGFKLGYKKDTGKHRTIRCLSWKNYSHGWDVQGGPCRIYNCVSFGNREDAFFGLKNKKNDVRNSFAFQNRLGNGLWVQGAAAFRVSASDFISLNDAGMLGPRQADGRLPETNFLKPVRGSRLVDAGADTGLPFQGRAPDIGFRESSGK